MKTRKIRLLSALLALAMLLALLPTAAFADTVVYGTFGNCGAEGDGSDVKWSLDTTTGTLTISGTGEMADYKVNFSTFKSTAPWANEQVTQVVINKGVTRIGNEAFFAIPSITSVSLPNGVKSIGKDAFSGWGSGGDPAPKIEGIKIPASVTDIEEGAFAGCEKLKTISFETDSELAKIGYFAFGNCPKLHEVTIPAGVTSIGWGAFSSCTNLESITIPSSVTSIDQYTFNNCSQLKEVTFEAPSGLCEENDNISDNAFTGCTKLSKINCEAALQEKLASKLPADVKPAFNITDATDSGSDTNPETYPITIDYGTAYDAEGNPIEKAAAGDVVTIEASETALEGMVFERWEVRKGNVKLENDRAAKTSFTMPEGEVQLEAMYQAADVEDSGWDAATVVTGAVIGTGTAILAYHIGLEVYAEQVLGKDVAVPRTRGEVALLAWQLAGSPAVNGKGEPLSEAAQAERWAVESGLMQNDAQGNFNGAKKMSKLNALRTLEKAKQ